MKRVYTFLTDEDYDKLVKKADSLGLRLPQIIFLLMAKTLGHDMTQDREDLLLDWEIATREEAETRPKSELGKGQGLVDSLVSELRKKSPQSTVALKRALGKNDTRVYKALWENTDLFVRVPEPPKREAQGKTGGRKRGRKPLWWDLTDKAR